MSYILDALKKSDQERKQGDVPNLQTMHLAVAPEQKNPWFIYALIVILLLALAFVIGIVMSPKKDAELSAVNRQEPLQAPNVRHGESSEIAKIRQQKTAIVKAEVVVEKTNMDEVSRYQETAPVLEEPNKVQRIKLADISEVPYLHELKAYQQQLVPELSFAGHVYSSVAASRSVIINGRAMSEGEAIMQGMTVEQITSKGVVFRYNDIIFRVDVLQDWSFE